MDLPLVAFTKFFKELSDADILTFRAFTKQEQEQLLKLLLPSKSALHLERAYRCNDEIVFKPESVTIGHKSNMIYFNVKSGMLCTELTDELFDVLLEMQSQQFYFKGRVVDKIVQNERNATYVIEIDSYYTATYDFDTAKQLLQEYKPIDLLMYAIGYKPCNESIAYKLSQLLPLFTFDDKAIHTVVFSIPRFGKSKTASVLTGLTNAYVTVFPTPAKLIYDGRSGKYGLTYWYNTLYIDEFDKIKGRRLERFQESYEVLLTGMSDGLWQRDISAKAEDFRNLVGFCFMGNIRDKTFDDYTLASYSRNNRERLHEWLEQYGIPSEPFIERITYIDIVTNGIQAYRLLNYNEQNKVMYLDPTVSRAVIKLLQSKVIEQNIAKRAECELDHHFNRLRAVLDTLCIDLDDATIESLVHGDTIFADVLSGDKQSQKTQDVQTCTNECDEIEVEEWDLSSAVR